MIQDVDGNKLFMVDDGIYLKLASDNKLKKIMHVKEGGIVKYVKSKHIMSHLVSGPMIGFNYQALKILPKSVKDVSVFLPTEIRRVNIQKILDRKEFLYFKKEGFEKQIFYPLELMEKIR